jgi:hypothetical protein
MATRKQIVDKAREYVGTPFQHQGRIKGMACDCVGLPLMVAEELGLKDVNGKAILVATETRIYSSQPMDSEVLTTAKNRLIEVSKSEMRDGDLVVMRVPSVPCHVALVSTVCGVAGMIHAISDVGKVVESIMDFKWQRRIVGVFRFPGVED